MRLDVLQLDASICATRRRPRFGKGRSSARAATHHFPASEAGEVGKLGWAPTARRGLCAPDSRAQDAAPAWNPAATFADVIDFMRPGSCPMARANDSRRQR